MRSKMVRRGYVVVDRCENWEQILGLDASPGMPPGGVLGWASYASCAMGAIFPSRKTAREAIRRTEHYRLAYGKEELPRAEFCRIVPVGEVVDVG